MTDNSKDILCCMGISLALVAVYMPVYTGYYAHWDDYYIFGGEYFRDTLVQLLREVHKRPLAAYLISWLGSFLKFENGNIVRFANVAGLCGIASIFFIWLRRNAVSRSRSVLLAVAIFMLPPFQIAAAQILTGPIVVLPMLVTAVAAIVAFRGTSGAPLWKALVNYHSFAAACLLLVVLLIYPPSAMFYWTMVAAVLLLGTRGRQPDIWRIVCLYAIPFIVMGIYFFVGRSMTAENPQPQSMYVFGLTQKPLEKIKWFVAGPLSDALAPWHIFPSVPFAIASGAVVLAGVIVALVFLVRAEDTTEFRKHLPGNVGRWLIVASLVPLSLLPNIVSAGEFAPYRTMVGFSPIVFLVMYWAVLNIARLLPKRVGNITVTVALAVAALIGAYKAYGNVVYYVVRPSTAEARYIRGVLAENDLTKFDRVLLITPQNSKVFSQSTFDEFGAVTSGSKTHRVPLLITLIETLPENARGGPLSLAFSTKENYRGADERTLVIDMSWMHSMYSNK